MATQNADIAVVGHFSLDSIRLPTNPHPYHILGGAAAFVSLVARRLGASAAVVSRVGGDFPPPYLTILEAEGVDVSAITKAANEQTTSFELAYNSDLSSRTLRLKRHGSPIRPEDLPASMYAKVIHVAPIADEISYELVEHLRQNCACLSIDPQGMTRRFDPDGNVACCTQMDRRILPLVDVYKSSLDEICVLTGQSELGRALEAVHGMGPKIVLATMGAQGSVLSVGGAVFTVPSCQPARVVDPTGAGDVFIGAFLVEYSRKKDPLWCACVGSAAASLVVEDVGTSCFGSKEEIYRRACAVYEKEIKP
jgi:2-dehydro-3-deoxygluconokinase